MGLFISDGSSAPFSSASDTLESRDLYLVITSDVTVHWGLTEEGRRKKGERNLITGSSFTFFFSHSHFKDRQKEKDIEKESVNHLT